MAPALETPVPRLRADLPFRRIAVVLAGGGALGAYEAGVLRVLEDLGLKPAILAGTSAGAINGSIWLAHGYKTEGLHQTWRDLRSASIGMRWTTLVLRAVGGGLLALGVLQALLTLLGSPDIALSTRVWGPGAAAHETLSVVLDVLAWAVLAASGIVLARLSGAAENWLAAFEGPAHPARLSRWIGYAVLVGVAVHLLTWAFHVPWPHRFSASVLAAGALVWLLMRPGAGRVRALLTRMLPETGGRGLWRGGARRRLLAKLIEEGDPRRLVEGDTLLIVTALAVDNGRIAHFISGPDPGPEFRERIEAEFGEVIRVVKPEEVIEAVAASSAIPLLFEPVKIRGRDFVDAGQFSNQPLAAARAADADATVVVLLAPIAGPRPQQGDENLLALGARLVELAHWRSLMQDLRALPVEWYRADAARPLVLVAPLDPLPGGLLSFAPELAGELVALGRRDARLALMAAGWLEEAVETASP